MPRTQAQKAQWQRRNTLGQLTSLARWILSKQRDVETSGLALERKERILALMHQLSDELWQAAKSLGWSPKPPPGYTAEELERDNPYNAWMRE